MPIFTTVLISSHKVTRIAELCNWAADKPHEFVGPFRITLLKELFLPPKRPFCNSKARKPHELDVLVTKPNQSFRQHTLIFPFRGFHPPQAATQIQSSLSCANTLLKLPHNAESAPLLSIINSIFTANVRQYKIQSLSDFMRHSGQPQAKKSAKTNAKTQGKNKTKI